MVGYEKYYFRKTLHTLVGVVFYLLYLISGNVEFYSFFMFMFGFGIAIAYSLGLHKRIKIIHDLLLGLRKKEEFLGESFLYIVSSFIIGSILLDEKWFFIMFWLITISDTFAFIVGFRYGKRRIFGNKTLEGFFGFLIASLPLFFVLPELKLAFVIIGSGIIELIDKLEDNISISVFLAIFKRLVG